MKLVYLHGFRSSALTSKVAHFEKSFPEWDVVALDYSPHNPRMAAALLKQYFDSLDETQEVVVVGTSLGGFWAKWVAANYFYPAVLVNPALNPSLEAGEYTVYGTDEKIYVPDASFDKYKCEGGMFSTLVAMDDIVIDPDYTVLYMTVRNRDVYKIPVGGHQFDRLDLIDKAVEEIRNVKVMC